MFSKRNKRKSKNTLKAERIKEELDFAQEQLVIKDRELVVFYLLQNNVKRRLPNQEGVANIVELVEEGNFNYIEYLDLYVNFVSSYLSILEQIKKILDDKERIVSNIIEYIDKDTMSIISDGIKKNNKEIDFYTKIKNSISAFTKRQDNKMVHNKIEREINKAKETTKIPVITDDFSVTRTTEISFEPNLNNNMVSEPIEDLNKTCEETFNIPIFQETNSFENLDKTQPLQLDKQNLQEKQIQKKNIKKEKNKNQANELLRMINHMMPE